VSSNEPVKNGCEVIYEMFHILNSQLTWFQIRSSICDRPRENQQKGDDTGTRACHGTLSVTCTTAYAHI